MGGGFISIITKRGARASPLPGPLPVPCWASDGLNGQICLTQAK